MKLPKYLLLSLLLCLIITSSASKCQPTFPCGNFNLSFPFTHILKPECGLFAVDNCNSGHPKIQLQAGGPRYDLLQVLPEAYKFSVRDSEQQKLLNEESCCLRNVSLPQSIFASLTLDSDSLTLFVCENKRNGTSYKKGFGKHICASHFTLYYRHTADNFIAASELILLECPRIQLPVSKKDSPGELFNWLTPTFTLEWQVSEDCSRCHCNGGLCLSNSRNELYCKKGTYRKFNKILFIGGMIIAALTSTLIIIFAFIRRKRSKAKEEHEKDMKLFLRKNGNLSPIRYKYSSIKKMTKSFSENLGKGGYGSVYKGKFPDGRLVAVKILNELNGNGEDFMNEVASISRTSHINIVALLGFCFEGSKRALIYDFMPNGSLEKFIDNTASSAAESELGWDKLFEIALGVARGLEYLHQGCNTRILHLDIKPQNILLDKDFYPRISDFGLAKMCPNRSSIVSMMGARGTIGYIAPEVISRNFGEVSYKSDVYSYGMLVLEVVRGRKSINRGDVHHTSEIYFPNYIYRQLEMDGDVVETMNDDETQVATKRNLIIVGLWCIQTNPKDRPPMTKVVEMLEGKLGALEVPPKPYLYSPPRSATILSSTFQSM